MDFKIIALDEELFEHFQKMSDDELEKQNIVKQIADNKPGFPCRISLQDAEIGEEVYLFNYEFHSVNSPYKASGPIFTRKNTSQKICETNEVPELFSARLISLRGYNSSQMLISADVFEEVELKEKIQSTFENPEISYLHIHNAKFGCYFASVKRA